MDKEISEILQEIKARTGWSETRLASELGTSQPTINRILRGQNDCAGSTWRAIDDLHKKIFAQSPELSPNPQECKEIV